MALLTRAHKSSRPYNPVSIIFDYLGCARGNKKPLQAKDYYTIGRVYKLRSGGVVVAVASAREEALARAKCNVHKSIRSRHSLRLTVVRRWRRHRYCRRGWKSARGVIYRRTAVESAVAVISRTVCFLIRIYTYTHIRCSLYTTTFMILLYIHPIRLRVRVCVSAWGNRNCLGGGFINERKIDGGGGGGNALKEAFWGVKK